MLWVYGQYKYVDPYSVGIDFSRQNLTSTDILSTKACKVDPRAVRVNNANFLFSRKKLII